jgi:hypothetical protein
VLLDIVSSDHGLSLRRGGKIDFALLHKSPEDLNCPGIQKIDTYAICFDEGLHSEVPATESKPLFSHVAKHAVMGDEIWALCGGQTLYVLRPMTRQSAEYMFIGECYVHGLMDGELVKAVQSGRYRNQVVSLIWQMVLDMEMVG